MSAAPLRAHGIYPKHETHTHGRATQLDKSVAVLRLSTESGRMREVELDEEDLARLLARGADTLATIVRVNRQKREGSS